MKKRLLSILMAVLMVTPVLTGCSKSSGSDDPNTGSTTETGSIGKDLPILGAGIYSSSDNFNSYIGKAIANSCNGVFSTNIEDGQNDQSTQNNQIDTMLAKGAKAVVVSVVDVTAAPTIIQKCKDAGDIPIIFFNKEITDQSVIGSYDKAYQVTSTGGDYGASIQGQMIVDYWKAHPEMDKNKDEKLQIIDIMGDPGHTAAQPRADFVKKTIEDAGISVDVLEEDTGMWDTAKAKDKMDAWISKYGDEIEVIDALPEMLDKIESGEVMGSVLQDAKTQGKVIVQMAANLVNGKEVLDGIDFVLEDGAKAVRVPYQAITADNLDVARSTYAE